MRTPVAASLGRAWMTRLVIVTAGVALGLVLGTGTAHADSPLDLGKATDKVVSSVAKTTSSVTKKPTAKVRTVVKRATKPVRSVTTIAHRVTKPVHRATKPVQRATKPVQRIVKRVEHAKPVQRATKPTQRATKPVQRATKPVQRATKAGRHTDRPHRATEPKRDSAESQKPTTKTTPSTAAPAPTDKPVLSSTVRTGTPLVGALTTDVATGVAATDRVLSAITTPLVTGATNQLPSSLRPVTDGVLRPVAAVHDTTLGLLDDTLVVTVPSVVDHVTTPLLQVLDGVENSLPGLPGIPGVPTVPVSPVGPLPAAPSVAALPALTVPRVTSTAAGIADHGAARTSDVSAAATQLSGMTAPWLIGADRADASVAAGTVVAVAATVASLGDLLGGLAGGFTDTTSVGVGPSGSATATALTLLLLALASSAGAFGAGARSLRVLGPLFQGPFRRAHRPGFSPD